MKTKGFGSRFLVICLAIAFIPTQLFAQQGGCDSDLDLAPWLNAISSNFVDGGASGDEVLGYTLCSSAPGPDQSLDSYRMLVQSAGGDFDLHITLTALTAKGSGGLVATLSGLDLADAARLLMWVEANPNDPTSGWLHSSLRRNIAGDAEPEPAPIAVELPLQLNMNRTGSILSNGFTDNNGDTIHLSTDVGGEVLGGTVRIGMVQFAGSGNAERIAEFNAPTLEVPEAPGLDCVEGDPVLGETPMVLGGKNLDAITSASLFGNRASILSQSSRNLVVQPTSLPTGGVNYGQAAFFSAASRHPIRIEIAAIGTPFIRGDANLDGIVDASDLGELDKWMTRGIEPRCPGAGDVNGDSYTNSADVDALKAWLEGRGSPPAAPFPNPGYVSGAFTCDAPTAPGIRSAKRQGRKSKLPLKEGDVIELSGKDIPSAEEMVVWFGDVRTRTLGGNSRSLRVEVEHVPSSGNRCARIIHVQSQSRGESLRIGGGWLAQEGSNKLCHDFAASPENGSRFYSEVARDGTLEISIPENAWQPGQLYTIDASVFMPWLDGVSRGSRELKMSYLAPAGGRNDYEDGMEGLAQAMTNVLNGDYTPADPCECELEVVPAPLVGKLILAPCLPPPPKPEPAVPGPDTLHKPNPILVGGISIAPNNPPPVECNGEPVSHLDDARNAAWCHFQDITQTIEEDTLEPPYDPYLGHPLFASWKPISTILDTSMGGMDAPWILDPDEQPIGQKMILFEPSIDEKMTLMGYNDPHVWALRLKHCKNFPKIWLPKVGFGDRIVKTFFVAESMLPSSLNLNGLYSYTPPDENEEHYLVGLHIAVSTLHDYSLAEGYFWWSSFWIPANINDTQTKGGQDLEWSYSPTCTVGNAVDQPLSLPAPWDRFIMCTDADPNHGACGNPYAFGECPLNGGTTSCTQCHADTGKNLFNIPNAGSEIFLMGWLPTIAGALNEQERDEAAQYVEDHPGEFTWWTEPRVDPNNPNSQPLSCLQSDPVLWNPLDPNDQPGNGEGEP